MIHDHFKPLLGEFSTHDLPTGGAGLVGLFLLFLLFKTEKFLLKVLIFLVAVALFAGAYWWHQHR